MMWKTIGEKSEFLSAIERILLALYLVNQEKSIWWLAGWLGPDYDGKNVYATLSRLGRRQLVIRKGKYQITQLGIAWIGRRFPLVVRLAPNHAYFGSWSTSTQPKSAGSGFGRASGIFASENSGPVRKGLNAVVIDAAEVKGRRRKLIFDELKRWRYGRLSRGVYLTGSAPAQAELAGFVDRYRLSGYVNLMTIQPAENPQILADRVFRLGERNSQWRLLIDRMFSLPLAPAKVRPYSQLTGLRRIRQDFLQMLVTEPGLPPELLPENYFMNKAIEIILINIDDRR